MAGFASREICLQMLKAAGMLKDQRSIVSLELTTEGGGEAAGDAPPARWALLRDRAASFRLLHTFVWHACYRQH